jgi:hypothetical protein
LRLGGRDIARLAPLGAEWLARGCPPDAMRLALTTGLPAEPVHNPAGFLRDRLRSKMPSPAAAEAPKAPVVAAALECDDCRAPLPRGHQGGVCKPCAVAGPEPEPTRSGLAAVRAALGGGLAAAFAMP